MVVRSDLHEHSIYGGMIFLDNMCKYRGKTVTIKSVACDRWYGIEGYRAEYFTDEMFEGLAMENNNKIVITTDGKTTTATLYRENGSKEVATAKCSPEDTFDFNFGAKLAMERLMEKTAEPKKPEPPKYFTGKVVCIENKIKDKDFTVGKVYEIKDGNFTDNYARIRPNTHGYNRVTNPSDLENEYYRNWHYKFIPIVE